MKVVIAGSRSIHHNVKQHQEHFDQLAAKFESEYGKISVVISGRATGPDKLGEMWAKKNGVGIAAFPADWDRFGKGAGHIRNEEMGVLAEAGIILWDGKSRGTSHMMGVMRKLKKPFILDVYEPIVINEYKQQPNGIIKIVRSDGTVSFSPKPS